MDLNNLHELINRYEENLDTIYEEHDELFKWKAMQTWNVEWNKPASAFHSFADRFKAATEDFSVFIDNSRLHPRSGALKLYEKAPKEVEHIFYETLFADTDGDILALQDQMDRFLDAYENLRQKYFSKNWSYKQDRHSASVFLAMIRPSFNYVYKSSEAKEMAKYIGFEYDIGSGKSFSLSNYYRLCDEIVAALRKHEGLLKKHFERLTDEHYKDESLHLLAFDLMYCCLTYNFYKGLMAPYVKKAVRNSKKQNQLAQKEAERLERITVLEQRITELEQSCGKYSDISLLGVEVTAVPYGVGVVIEQEINKIKVRFDTIEKAYILDKKHISRPKFEEDEEIISAFTEYGQITDEIKKSKREIAILLKKME